MTSGKKVGGYRRVIICKTLLNLKISHSQMIRTLQGEGLASQYTLQTPAVSKHGSPSPP